MEGGPAVDSDWLHAAARAGLPRGTTDKAHGLLLRLEHSEPALAAPAALSVVAARLRTCGPEDSLARHALAVADRTISTTPRLSRTQARLAELKVRCDGPRADTELANARRLYGQLGDKAALTRLDARTDPLPTAVAAITLNERQLPEWVLELTVIRGSEPVPWQLIQRLGDDWEEFARSLADVVESRIANRPARPDLPLIIGDSPLHVIPWELAAAHVGGVASICRVAPPPVPELVLPPEGPRRPRVVVLTPPGRLEDAKVRGSENWVEILLDMYAGAGFEPEAIEVTDEERAVRRAGGAPVAVLHALAPFADLEGTPAIDLLGISQSRAIDLPGISQSRGLKGVPGSGAPGALHQSRFRRLVDSITSSVEVRPILVLDPPSPNNPLESAVQLAQRNAFAGALFDGGGFPGILGAGLIPSDLRNSGYRVLADELAAGTGLGQLARRLRDVLAARARDSRMGAPLGPAAIAAFAVRADLRAPFTPSSDR